MKYVSTQDLSAFDNFFNELKVLENKKVSYGYFDERHYSGLNMATLAAIHEQGWNGLPQRDFIYSTQIAFKADLNKMTRQLMYDIINRKGHEEGLRRIGNAGVKKMKYVIDTGAFSNNTVSDNWAAVKGFNEALIHYGDLREATSFKVTPYNPKERD
ncbi:hypothetical protein [Acinetobacter phage ABPH49]|nr:hypothetical protein [Acinetobacter phage ABPH49]